MPRPSTRNLAVLACLALAAGGCASEDGAAGPESSTVKKALEKAVDVSVCQVTDANGIDDRSFNQTVHDGLVRAEEELGVTTKVLESSAPTDFEPNLDAFMDEECTLIVPVGFPLAAPTATAAAEHPDQRFALVDVDLFDQSSGQDVSLDNVRELTFATDEAAFLAGYAAAGTSSSGKVGTFGGMQMPTVTIFMDGFLAGVQQYNADHHTTVELLGWDGSNGLFTGDFTDQDKGRMTTEALIDEGADVIMPVAGQVGLGAVAAVEATGRDDLALVWVDTDGCRSVPDACALFLTSVEKKMDDAVFDTITEVVDGGFTGGIHEGTLGNGGVDIAEFHEWSDRVPEDVRNRIDAYRDRIVEGTQSVEPN
jgi:basic membrane protein A